MTNKPRPLVDPIPTQDPPSSEDLKEIRTLLEQDRDRTARRIEALTGDIGSITDATRFTATDDEHDPEGSTIAFERSQASALRQAAVDHLAEIDAATGRLSEGTYGRCEKCGDWIATARLHARPATTLCIRCAASTG